MENSANNVPTPKKSLSKKKLLFIVGSSIVFVAVVILTVFLINRFQTIHEVQTALSNAASVIQKANGDNGYPQILPSNAATDKKVQLKGGGSFDGTTYCIVGTSVSDNSIVYHISLDNKKPQADGCPKITAISKPGSVSGVETTIISAGQLGFTWNSAPGGASYTLQCASDQNFSQVLSSSMKSSQTRTCNNLNQLTTYYVRIRANNALGAGPWSPIFTSTTKGLSTAPTANSLTPISSTSIHYVWTAVSGAQNYIVEWASDINFIKSLKTMAISGTSVTATGLLPNTRYFFHVKAVTAGFDAAHAAFSQESYISTPAS